MDGGSALCPLLFRIRLKPGEQIRRLFEKDDLKKPSAWRFGEVALATLALSNLGIPWLVLKSEHDETFSTVGLAVPVWERYWVEEIVDVEKSFDGEKWDEIEDRDWEVLRNVTGA